MYMYDMYMYMRMYSCTFIVRAKAQTIHALQAQTLYDVHAGDPV